MQVFVETNTKKAATNAQHSGKECLSCKKMNHFTTQCRLNTKVNVVETDEDEDDEYCLTLESEIQSDQKHAKKLFATFLR